MIPFKTCLFMLLLKALFAMSDDGFISVDPDTQMLKDKFGRERFFHGTNVVYKHFPFHPDVNGFGPDTFSEKDMQILKELGHNSIRLGMMLPGYVPKRGKYNESYIEVIEYIVNTAAKYGIYTLLDMHQDVLSPKFCVEGMPDWIVDTQDAKPFPFPLENVVDAYKIDNKTGYPDPEDCKKNDWGNYYFTEAASKAFQSIYDNRNGLLDEWGKFWGKTAKKFSGNNYVIGYELINEPFAGDIFEKPILLVPGIADKMNLEPTYDKLQKYIRAEDDQHIIFFEGVTWDFFSVGFDKVPGGENYRNRSVLSYHYYEPPDFSKTLNFHARQIDLERLKCGGFLTEMYTVGSDFDSMYKMFDLCDEYKQSWHGWMYKPYGCIEMYLACENSTNHSGGKGEININDTSRTYPQAVAGRTKRYNFNKDTHVFKLEYEVAAIESLVTEIYFNKKLHYPKGYNYTIMPKEVKFHESPDGLKIFLEHLADMVEGTKISFQLFPIK